MACGIELVIDMRSVRLSFREIWKWFKPLLSFIEVLNKLSAEKIREEGGCEIKELPCLS